MHISQVDPSHTIKDMQIILSTQFPEVKSEVFNSKQPSIYLSFKISICSWPYGALIVVKFFRNIPGNPIFTPNLLLSDVDTINSNKISQLIIDTNQLNKKLLLKSV